MQGLWWRDPRKSCNSEAKGRVFKGYDQREKKVRKEMSVDFKKSGYKGNQRLRQQLERGAVLPGGRNVCALWDGNTEIVLQTLAGTLII